MKPLLLDLFCGAGGAARGYADAGFEVVGIDEVDQPRYPFRFVRGDALDTSLWPAGVAAIHASPPCQRFSGMSACRPGLAVTYPDLIGPTREALRASGRPWVIENVPGAPLVDPIVLCGLTFGLMTYRHRLFECNWHAKPPAHLPHRVSTSRAGHWRPGTMISVAGNFAPAAVARDAMGIHWMRRGELAEAIPPAYTRHLGAQLLQHLS